MNIRKGFIAFSILWGIIPVIISTSIYIANFNAKTIEMAKQNVVTSANDQSIHLEAFFEQNISNLNINSNIPVVKDALIHSDNKINDENSKRDIQVLNEIFSNGKNEQFFLAKEMLIDKNGIIIASSDKEDISRETILTSDELNMLLNNKLVVTNIIQRQDFNKGIKSTIIAIPIFFENQYQGSIARVINMSYFEKLVNDVRFFETGKMAIMDRNGVFAASNSKEAEQSINEINVPNNLYERWNEIDFKRNPNGIIEYNVNGVEKIGYYSTIDNSGWIVLSGVEWAEFKNPIYQSINTIVAFGIFILILIIASYTFIINHFSKPVYKLLEVIRKMKQGNYKDRFIYNKNNEFGEIATAFNELMDNIERNKKYTEEKNRNLQSLTSNIPGGVHRCRIENGKYILDFASSGWLNLLGYKKYEFKEVFNKKLGELIYEKDREQTISEMKEQLGKYNKYSVEYRIKQKDGNIIWVLDNGQIVTNKDGRTFIYSVAINITKSKMIQEDLRLSEERYRIIMSQTEDIIFEWNINEDTIYYSGNWKSKFGYNPITEDISQNISRTENIHKDDIKKLGKLLNEIIYGNSYKETEIRIKKSNGKYIWCKIRITAMFDQNRNIFKAIGAIIDIDKEKIETEKLIYKSQRDSLTGLYNKITAQNLIEEYMQSEDENKKGALFVIDLDNFKAINDNLGHLAGDYVLTSISSVFSEVFIKDSIVGRIGGDEFIVFLKDIDSEEFIHKKAEELVNGLRAVSIKEIADYKVSGSIGIAKYPEHGNNFKELFINADKAVYLAKNNGKDNYFILEEV